MKRRRQMLSLLGGLVVLCALCCGACDGPKDPPKAAAPDSGPLFLSTDREAPPQGCKRNGSIDALENDPSCVVDVADADEVDAALKNISITLTPDTESTVPGGVIVMRLTLANVSSSPISMVLEADEGPKPHMDALGRWDAGGPDSGVVRWFHFDIKTLNANDRSVDLMKMPKPAQGDRRLVRVFVPPKGKLVRTFQWFAIWFPPLPKNDPDAAVHIEYKPNPTKLNRGKYTVRVGVPLYRAEGEQRFADALVTVAN